jgi:hypothetical protein
MKNYFFAAAALLAVSSFGLYSCEDSMQLDITHASHADLRKRDVKQKAAQPLEETGKIYVKDNFLYINEKNKGVHIYDNTNPEKPNQVGYMAIPGNLDVAMKGDYLYADSYMDLVAINVKTKKTTRVNDVFKGSFDEMRREGRFAALGADGNYLFSKSFQAVNNFGGGGGSNNGGGTGTAGSMARFAIVGDVLYVLDGSSMKVFDITDQENPKQVSETKMDFAIETIFPEGDKLFIGGTQGMFIYDNTDPMKPVAVGKFEHLFSCDPVVVQNDIAYITLRNGTPCRTTVNQLDIVDVKDPKNPTLLKSYPMHNPHGLSIQGNTLYVCDGNQGLKVLDVTDVNDIKTVGKDPSLRKAYDVIALGEQKTLVVVGKEGIFQYNNSDPANLKQLSVIPVQAKG